MEKVEFVKGMSYLGVAIGKEYSQEECDVFYDFLKDYNYKVFVQAIKSRIKKSSYAPKINELIEECKFCEKEQSFKILNFMKYKGYFKNIREYDKAMLFVKRDIIPWWLQKDIDTYCEAMNSKTLEIGEGNV